MHFDPSFLLLGATGFTSLAGVPNGGWYDSLRLVLLGLVVELARRAFRLAHHICTHGFNYTVRISNNDEANDWMLRYISSQTVSTSTEHRPSVTGSDDSTTPHHGRQDYSFLSYAAESIWPAGRAAARDVQIFSRRPRLSPDLQMMGGMNDSALFADYRAKYRKQRAQFYIVPAPGVAHYINFKGHNIRVLLSKGEMVALQRKEKWMVMSTATGAAEPRTTIYSVQPTQGVWMRASTRPVRPWDSVILPSGVKEWVYRDAAEFLAEKKFYLRRGLPYRRGYLFYGVPGSGKSSLISALAAKLDLDIYIVNLGSPLLNDDSLAQLLQSCPAKCLLLMEDIDCAFPHRGHNTRNLTTPMDEDVQQMPPPATSVVPAIEQMLTPPQTPLSSSNSLMLKTKGSRNTRQPAVGTGITLSGLLNALDGVASSDGRLLFCTTNWREHIDPALSRPGRCDVWIEFKNATRAQARELFLHFYDPEHDRDPAASQRSSDALDVREGCGSSDDGRVDEKMTVPVGITSHIDSAAQSTPIGENPISLGRLADEFANHIPEDEISISALQGYLVRYKRRPGDAATGVARWVRDGYGQGPAGMASA